LIPADFYKKVTKNPTALGPDDLITLGLHLIQLGVEIAGVLAVILVMLSGYNYVASGISESKEKAKSMLLNSLIGFAVCVFSWIIVDLVITFMTFENY